MRRGLRIEIVSLVLGVLVALPSLAYPFGRDQGLYYYVGREWLLRGALPYRDLFDQKPPGIYAIHAVCIAVFGEHLWGIRVADLLAVAVIGLLAGSLDRQKPVRYATVLGASILYFGFLTFWDTAQCEVWCALFIMVALFSVERGPGAWSGAAAGLALGLALLMKPPVIVFAPLLAWRMRRRGESPKRMLLALGVSGFPFLVTLTYFASRGGAPALFDVLVRANGYYAANENIGGLTDALTRTLDVLRQYSPVSTFLLYATAALAWVRRAHPERADPHRLALAATVAAFACVVVQWKFYTYHFGVLLVPGPLAVAALAREAEERWASGRAIVLAHTLVLFALSWTYEHQWLAVALDLVRYEEGAIPRSRLNAHFAFADIRFDTDENEAVVGWLREHARPDDRLCVRGFEPEVYAMSGMRCPGRFFWTSWLVDPSRAYRRDEFLAEDRAMLEQERPRFVTVRTEANPFGRADSEDYMARLGYGRVVQIGRFIVMEKPAP